MGVESDNLKTNVPSVVTISMSLFLSFLFILICVCATATAPKNIEKQQNKKILNGNGTFIDKVLLNLRK